MTIVPGSLREHVLGIFNKCGGEASAAEQELFGQTINSLGNLEYISEHQQNFRRPYLEEAFRLVHYCQQYEVGINPTLVGKSLTALQPWRKQPLKIHTKSDEQKQEVHGTIECEQCKSQNVRADNTQQFPVQKRSSDEPVSILSICGTCSSRQWIE